MQFDLSKAKDGILLVDKPANWTSFDVVAKIRGQIRAEYRVRDEKPTKRELKVGHAGTLDPFATGLLIVLLGDATKQADTFLKLDKEYEATIRLGQTSSTGDPEGELTDVNERQPALDEINAVIGAFTGQITQTPPIYSAIKVGGQRAYKLARAGKVPDIPTRQVTIHSIEVRGYDYPDLKIRTQVSSGTYIRTLAQDIGAALRTGAYCHELRRTKIDTFSVSDAQTIESKEDHDTTTK